MMNTYSILKLRVGNERVFCIKLKEIYNAIARAFNRSDNRKGNSYCKGLTNNLTIVVYFLYINFDYVENLSNEDLHMVLDLLMLAKSQNIREAFTWINPMIVQNLYENYTNSR